MKKSKKPLIFIIIGILLISYPIVSQILHYIQASTVVNEYKENVAALKSEDIENRIKLSKAYNDALEVSNLHDPFTDLQKSGLREYARMLEVKEKIGIIEIPSIYVNLPISAGTTEEVLGTGAGHLEGSSLPVGGINTHTVITAHRGLPSARLFTDLDKVAVNDIFYIHNIKETLAYQVYKIEVVEPDDLEKVQIVEGEDLATLLTCTPYMINSHRLLVHGKRIEFKTDVKQAIEKVSSSNLLLWFIFGIVAIIVLILIVTMIILVNKKSKKRA